MNTLPLSGCAKCATLGKTCCQQREIFVTEGDKLRIAEFTGDFSFWENTVPTDPSYYDQDDDPNWLKWVFQPDGSRPVLKRLVNGDCRFLSPAGCALPMETRPIVCRMYPYTYTEHGIDGVCDDCPPAVIPPGQSILQVLDMRLEDATRWHQQLYAELRTKERCDAHRIDLRPAC